jgi:hypothetical protein
MKKYMIALIVIACFMLMYAGLPWFSRNFTGTTTNSYVVADSVVTTDIDNITFILENSGSSSNNLSFEVHRYYGSWSGIYYTAKLDTLSDDEVGRLPMDDIAYGIKVLVKSSVADNHTTYNGYFNYKR